MIHNISSEEWGKFDLMLAEIERGIEKEDNLWNNETFLHMLAAIKADPNNYGQIPHFIRESKICKKYFTQVNPLAELFFKNTTTPEIQIYKKYLGLQDANCGDNDERYNDKNSCKIMSGKELKLCKAEKLKEYKKRDQNILTERYENFCRKMCEIWESAKIEEQLVKNDVAYIEGYVTDLTRKEKEYDINFLRLRDYSYQISKAVEPKVHKMQSANDYYQYSHAGKEKLQSVLDSELGFDYEFLQRFMNEYDYEWELGIIPQQVERPTYYAYDLLFAIFELIRQIKSDEWLLVRFQYVLKIKCRK